MKQPIVFLFFVFISFSNYAQQQTHSTFFCPPCDMDCDLIAYNEAGKCEHCNMELVPRTMEKQKSIIEAIKNAKNINVAVYMQEGMEILDFAGPVEVFTYAGMNVYTVGETEKPILSQGVVTITPQYTIKNCPKPNIIVFLGGNGTNASKNEAVLTWLKKNAEAADHLFSVCTGAFFLGRAGLLDGLTTTTFHTAIPALRTIVPSATVLDDARFVDNGKVITTAGISAGIDGSLHLVSKLFGLERAKEVARYMEYDKWNPEEGVIMEQ